MRRLGYILAALLALGRSAAHADQGWSDNQDGMNFACYDVGSFSANNLTSGGATYSQPGTGTIVNAPLAWWSQSAWFVDPQNSSGNASDSNTGLTSAVPLLSWAELSRRLWGATTAGIVTITAMSDGNPTDSVVMNVFIPVSAASYGYLVTGPFNSVYSGTVTTYTAGAAGPVADDYEITDSTLPSSFTASGLLADGLLARTTSGATRYFYVAKDLGSKTARISVPVTSGGGASSLTNGQTYEVDKLVKIYGLEWPNLGAQSTTNAGIFLAYKFIADESPGFAWQPAFFFHTWRLSASDTDTAFQATNIAIGTSLLSSFRLGKAPTTSFNNGLIRSSILIESGPFSLGGTLFEGGIIQLQRGARLITQSRFDVDDTSTAMIQVLAGSSATFSGPGNLSGVGNSGNIFSVAGGGSVVYDNTPVTAASTSGTQISVNGTGYTVAALPVSDPNSGSGVRKTTAPSYTAGCAQFTASGILSSTGTSCGSGGGTVTGVTGSGGVKVTPSSPNPNVTLDAFTCPGGEFVSSSSTSGLACTLPPYQTWTDGAFTPLPQETFSTAGAGLTIADDPGDTATVVSLPTTGSAGSCTNCSLSFDIFGRETARASGTAPVTSIGVTAPITSTGGTTPTIGISLPANQVATGTGTNVTSSANFTFASGTATVIGTTPLVIGAGATGSATSLRDPDDLAGFAQMRVYPNSGTNAGQSWNIVPRGTGFSSTIKAQINVFNTDVIADGSNFEFSGLRAAGTQFLFATGHVGTGAARPIMFASDWLTNGTTNNNQWLLNTDGSLQTDTGKILIKAIAAPSTPASGYGAVYIDSTSKNIAIKNDAGTVNHGIQTQTCGANTFASATTDAGALTCTQPAFSNLSGSATCAQLPALTGDITTSAGSCATVNTTKGKIYVDATDAAAHSPDYLYPKLTSFTNTVSFSPIGTGDGQLTIDVVPSVYNRTKRDYTLDTSAIGGIPTTNSWLFSGNGLVGQTGLPIEYPNDFQAGHIALTAYIFANHISAGTVTIQATLNGTAISGTAFMFTSGTSTGEAAISPQVTGSASASDTYGLAVQTSVGYAGTFSEITFQIVLTP